MTAEVTIEFGDVVYDLNGDESVTLGRAADLVVDDNPYLHRRLLQVSADSGVWWLANIGQSIPVSVATDQGEFQALLGPGARLPIVFPRLRVMFTAGPNTYEVAITCHGSLLSPADPSDAVAGDATRVPLALTESQKLLVLALAEPMLLNPGHGLTTVPTSAVAAERLGWPVTTFNRKLDAVCEKLDRGGVDGLRGGAGNLASLRKSRLVEYALLARLVSASDLVLLDRIGDSSAP
ncbi:hypothetical protein [Demequina oxidasica]|uniref:hypothetical protein n=1 Tax=Demequina oxidasica TaxID=676199 RepID=UPI0007858522|nr:hypothetical protein [Demequina oxidasica]